MKRVSLRLEDEEHEQIRQVAEKQGRSINTIIRRKLFGAKVKPIKGEKRG